jgi:hypothetical protein
VRKSSIADGKAPLSAGAPVSERRERIDGDRLCWEN